MQGVFDDKIEFSEILSCLIVSRHPRVRTLVSLLLAQHEATGLGLMSPQRFAGAYSLISALKRTGARG
jgi:hypothetical protein